MKKSIWLSIVMMILMVSIASAFWENISANPIGNWTTAGDVTIDGDGILILNDPDGSQEKAGHSIVHLFPTGDITCFNMTWQVLNTDSINKIFSSIIYDSADVALSVGRTVDVQTTTAEVFSSGGQTYGGIASNVWYNFSARICNISQNYNITLNGTQEITNKAFSNGNKALSHIAVGTNGNDAGYIVKFRNIIIFNESQPVPVTSNIDLLFANSTAPTTFESSFDAGENFYVYCNATLSNGIIMNDSTADVNVTFTQIVVEEESDITDFTLCQSGCDNSTITDSFLLHVNNSDGNVTIDGVRLEMCHLDNTINTLNVTFNCNGTSDSVIVPAVSIPSCSVGLSSLLFALSSTCINFSQVDVNLTTTAVNESFGFNISLFEYDRLLNNHLNTLTDGEVIFNQTLGMFRTNHSHEHYIAGLYNSTCIVSYTPDSSLSGNVTKNVTIGNIPPEIEFNQVNTSLGLTTLSDEVIIEFANGTWNWFVTIEEGNISSVQYNITDDANNLIFQVNTTDAIVFNTSSDLFSGFDNPFNLQIYVNDSDGAEDMDDISFNVTDTIAVVCTGFPDSSVVADTFFNWTLADSSCTDERLAIFDVGCNNTGFDFNFTLTGINATSYNFRNGTNITDANVTCQFSVSDFFTTLEFNQSIIGILDVDISNLFPLDNRVDGDGNIIFSMTIDQDASCRLFLNESLNQTATSFSAGDRAFPLLMFENATSHNWTMECNGTNGRAINTTRRTFSVLLTVPLDVFGEFSPETCMLDTTEGNWTFFIMLIFLFSAMISNIVVFKDIPIVNYIVAFGFLYLSFAMHPCSIMMSIPIFAGAITFYGFATVKGISDLMWEVTKDARRKKL